MRAEESGRRLGVVRPRLKELELDGLIVSTPPNIRFLSGFSGSLGYLLIGAATADIVGDSRYWVQMEEVASAFSLVRAGTSLGLWQLVAERIKAVGWRRTGFEAQHLTVDQYQRLRASLEEACVLVPTVGLVEGLRMVKTEQEVEAPRKGAASAGRSVDQVRFAL